MLIINPFIVVESALIVAVFALSLQTLLRHLTKSGEDKKLPWGKIVRAVIGIAVTGFIFLNMPEAQKILTLAFAMVLMWASTHALGCLPRLVLLLILVSVAVIILGKSLIQVRSIQESFSSVQSTVAAALTGEPTVARMYRSLGNTGSCLPMQLHGTTAVANLRASSSTGSAIQAQLQPQSTFLVLFADGEWLEVVTSRGIGWLHASNTSWPVKCRG